MSFKIIVDSCCDLTPAMLRSGNFISVPLTIGWATPWWWTTPPLTRPPCCGG